MEFILFPFIGVVITLVADSQLDRYWLTIDCMKSLRS